MAERNWYIEPNDNLQGYDIMKRDSVIKEDGTLGPEKICTIYSMDYTDVIIEALANKDNLDIEGIDFSGPITEI